MGIEDGVSNSELTTWQDCKRRWMLRYYLRLGKRPELESPVGVMHLGSRLHVALEYMYGWDADPHEVLKIVYRAAKENQPDTVVDKLTKEHELADKMIEGYVEWLRDTGADEGLTVVSTERDVTVDGPHGVKLRARLDSRVRRDSDGAIRFIDHKTTGDFTKLAATLEINSQSRFYALVDKLEAEQSGSGDRTDGGLFNMIKRTKRTARAVPPFYARQEIVYNDETLRSVWLKVSAVIGEILEARERLDAGEDHRHVTYPSPSFDCDWKCDFASICPLMDDGSRWEDMSRAEFIETDPYGYYTPSEIPELTELRGTTD